MPGLLFVSQVALEAWAEQKKIEFQGNVMTLTAGEGRGRSYALDPAVLFLKVVNAERDPHQLVAKVKTEAKLRELGAEHLADSVVLGDVAYEVQPGFLAMTPCESANVAKGAGAALEASVASPGGQVSEAAKAEALPRGLEEKRREAEALARYLLENLS